jgi:hypothetical protein
MNMEFILTLTTISWVNSNTDVYAKGISIMRKCAGVSSVAVNFK